MKKNTLSRIQKILMLAIFNIMAVTLQAQNSSSNSDYPMYSVDDQQFFTGDSNKSTVPNSPEDFPMYADALHKDQPLFSKNFSRPNVKTSFDERYELLVSHAYLKLISEAEKAEKTLKSELEQYTFENDNFDRSSNVNFQKKLTTAGNRYKRHSSMLAGLKSWNLLSIYPTGDIEYFMNENKTRIFKMSRSGFSNSRMVEFLIYKLADLYHRENN